MNQSKAPRVTVFGVLTLVTTIILILFSFNYPLLGSLGAESGMLCGAVLGPLLFLGASIRGAYRDERGFGRDALHQFALCTLALLVLGLALFINSFFEPSCAPARGLIPFLTHAAPVLAFNVACGLLIGRLCGNRLLAFLGALLVGGAYAAFRAWEWWQNPSFRLASHPFVVIDGDMFQGAGLSDAVIVFRVATMLFAVALLMVGLLAYPPAQRQTHASERVSIFSYLAPALVLTLVASSLHFGITSELEPSMSEREEVLSRETRRGQYVVHSDPSKTSARQALATAAEAALWGSRLRERAGELDASDIHIWLYADEQSLKQFTGAAHVHFALPAHRTIHLVSEDVPHPTLGHEIAHVVVGERVPNLTGVPSVWGVIPNQGLTEGLAVLLTPELSIKVDLTIEQQAAALAQSEMLPDLNGIFSLSPLAFSSNNSSIAYSVAGAYLSELSAKIPTPEKKWAFIKRLAEEGTIDAAFDSDEARVKFNDEFATKLKSLSLPKDAVPSVLALFSTPSILKQTCTDSQVKAPDMSDDPIAIAQQLEKDAAQNAPNLIAKKQILLDEAADNYWQGKDTTRAIELWRKVQPELLSPARARQQEAKIIFSNNAESNISKRALDYLVYSAGDTKRAFAAAIKLGAELARVKTDEESESTTSNLNEDLANYLATRAQIQAMGLGAKELALLERIGTNKQLPQSFQLESARLIAHARALSSKASAGAEQFQRLATSATRAADQLRFADFAQRAALIANALKLDNGDLHKSDIWLLGTLRFDS